MDNLKFCSLNSSVKKIQSKIDSTGRKKTSVTGQKIWTNCTKEENSSGQLSWTGTGKLHYSGGKMAEADMSGQ